MDKLKAYEYLLGECFGIDLNANDFFHYATAQMVTVVEADFHWVIPHIQKWGVDGVHSAMAYIQNERPLPHYINSNMESAINELVDRKQEVLGDMDWKCYYYNLNGPYRTINIDL
jgi:hypothetical protein